VRGIRNSKNEKHEISKPLSFFH